MKNVQSKKVVVGNIPISCSETQLTALFQRAGTVASVAVSLDRKTGRARGFAIVEMETPDQADAAVKLLDGATVDGRQIVVNRSQP
jgi:RNA recognition motif-containing protein